MIAPQGIHINISSLVSQFSFTTTFVYGLHTIVARRDLWDSLWMLYPTCPWMVLADFNSILSQDDKQKGSAVSNYEIVDFNDCCLRFGFMRP